MAVVGKAIVVLTSTMSEENEHTSEETEAEMNTENHDKEQSKSETCMLNNETEQPMLEDEEMPTYISVSTPSKREDSDINNAKQQSRIPLEEDNSQSPYHSDDQGGGSIYVLSSGEESNHPYNDEDEDEYVDSEDTNEMELENEHENAMLEDEEEEDEDDDDDDDEVNPLRLHNDDYEDIDTEYEPICFDRASDDFILNNRLKPRHKEKSLSLQDLSISKKNAHLRYNKKRHSLNAFRYNYLRMQQNPILYPTTQKRQMIPSKYQHVESKVKQYIKNVKEQNRRSMEKRMKEQEFTINKNYEENENCDTERLKNTRITNKTIKDYVEKAIQDLQQEEIESNNLMYDNAQLLENGENNKTSNRVIENQYKHSRKDIEYNDVQNEKRMQNSDDKLEKRNGSVDVNKHHIEYQNTLDKNIKFGSINQSSLVNNHQSTPTFINLRTLSYEEYMHDDSNTGRREELSEHRQEKTNETRVYNEAEMITSQEIDNSNVDCPLKIASVKSICTMQDESENLNFTKINTTEKVSIENNTEVIELKARLSQKDAQFHNLRDAYQKVLTENIKMKQELDVLKNSLAKYKNENRTCETKIASVQTETIKESISNQDTVTSEETNNKISRSSVASTGSSNDQWIESDYSPAISIKPPDLTPILNSDDSIVLTDANVPKKVMHPLSRTFITSSRILQTLSNITQDCDSPIHTSCSKKRKATEMPGSSTFVKPFKIPHTTVESLEGKNSINSTNDVEYKYSKEHVSPKIEQEESTEVNKNINGPISVETKMEGTDDCEDNVKCFIYREDENSKNKSFLIQAGESTKNELDDEKNRIQECGPYLLGNLEVRMSEINGTISVWGKEINNEYTSDNEDDVEESEKKSSEKKTCHFWPNTSQTRFNGSPLMCSTNKKQKIPLKFNRSNISQCCHSLSLNSIKMHPSVDDIGDKRHTNNTFSPNTSISSCKNCNSSTCRKERSICKDTSQEKLHSCCVHHIEIIDKECNCGSYHEKQKHDVNLKHCKDKFHNKGIRRNLCKNIFTSDSKNHSHENCTANIDKGICKYHTCRCSLQNVTDNNSSRSQCCNVVKDVSCTYKFSDNINNMEIHRNSDRCNHSSSKDGEEDPLIPLKRTNETLEARQRRLSGGKRVRGILMDFLKGCGDCRNNSSLSKNNCQQKETPYTVNNGPPQIKISPSSIPEPTCSTSIQCNDRCCHAYARRIESQLEEFRIEMERIRSRSDAILDMLGILHSVDMN
ncbi:MATH and LRR domain-containing protein PFE0570w isoform X3 [Apis florea]|uniref:MATH and LRR domain-containing protein PFE0570w isoform X3 n=1 Tax=Apis florea TaxID=7463 RepID=UPI00062984A3|nr:MATH and LRR domain-containing protein PFE0570w isoform X3 [Apis florea]